MGRDMKLNNDLNHHRSITLDCCDIEVVLGGIYQVQYLVGSI